MSSDDTSQFAFFGYGSLVNELTWSRSYNAQPGEIYGWDREWKHCVDTPFGRVCALTVAPKLGSVVQGVFITCPDTELAVLDQREIGYRRERLREGQFRSKALPNVHDVFVYRSLPEVYRDGNLRYPIWLSYVESVLYGYLRVFGEEGVDRFIKSTTGWTAPIIDDRSNPLYPRAVRLSSDARELIERKIQKISEIKIHNLSAIGLLP